MAKSYLSFLLRLWQIDIPQKQAWLASLEDPHTRQVMSFNTLDELFEFITKQTMLGVGGSEDNATHLSEGKKSSRTSG